jgi:hypothetical protein
MSDELQRIEERLQELSESFGADGASQPLPAALNGALDALRGSLEDHVASLNRWDQEECIVCNEVWPCNVVSNVMTKLGLGAPAPASLPPIPEQNVPPLLIGLKNVINAAIIRSDIAMLADALGHIVVDHMSGEHGECSRCRVAWPCPPIELLARDWGLALSPHNIGSEQWIEKAPTVKTPLELAEGIRHALQDVGMAGYQVYLNDDNMVIGQVGKVMSARVSRGVDDGAWTVQTWQDAT